MDIIGAIEQILRVGAEECYGYALNNDMIRNGRVLEAMADEALRIKERREK